MMTAERQALLLLATLLGLGVGAVASTTAPTLPSCCSAAVRRQRDARKIGFGCRDVLAGGSSSALSCFRWTSKRTSAAGVRGGAVASDRYHARMQVMITRNMRKVLVDELDYLPEEVDDMDPQIAAVVIEKSLPRPRAGMPIAWRRSIRQTGSGAPPNPVRLLAGAIQVALEGVVKGVSAVVAFPFVVAGKGAGVVRRGGSAGMVAAAAVVCLGLVATMGTSEPAERGDADDVSPRNAGLGVLGENLAAAKAMLRSRGRGSAGADDTGGGGKSSSGKEKGGGGGGGGSGNGRGARRGGTADGKAGGRWFGTEEKSPSKIDSSRTTAGAGASSGRRKKDEEKFPEYSTDFSGGDAGADEDEDEDEDEDDWRDFSGRKEDSAGGWGGEGETLKQMKPKAARVSGNLPENVPGTIGRQQPRKRSGGAGAGGGGGGRSGSASGYGSQQRSGGGGGGGLQKKGRRTPKPPRESVVPGGDIGVAVGAAADGSQSREKSAATLERKRASGAGAGRGARAGERKSEERSRQRSRGGQWRAGNSEEVCPDAPVSPNAGGAVWFEDLPPAPPAPDTIGVLDEEDQERARAEEDRRPRWGRRPLSEHIPSEEEMETWDSKIEASDTWLDRGINKAMGSLFGGGGGGGDGDDGEEEE